MADPTIIGRETSISGRVEGQGDLLVEGRVQGTIELSETLTVGVDGRVSGEVRVQTMIIEGIFDGEVDATERVILKATARAVADITAPIVEMEDGARLRGEVTIGAGEARSSTSSTSRSTSTSSRSSAPSTPRSRQTPATTPTPTTTPSSPDPVSTAAQASVATAATTTTTTVVEEAPQPPELDEITVAENVAENVAEEVIDDLREDYTVKELRDELRGRDLMVSGTKDELIERLLNARSEESV